MVNSTDWKRTSPIAVLFFLVNAISKLSINALPAIAVGFAAFASASGGRKTLIVGGLMVFAGLAVVASVLSWLRFRYRVDGERVLVRSGILQREELSVRFDRIQNVNIREPFYMRPFGLALLNIDTAGSGEKEIILGGIGKALAQELRTKILAESSKDSPKTQAEALDSGKDPVLLTRSTRDIVIYGLTANFTIWVTIGVGAIFGASDFKDRLGAWMVANIDQSRVEAMIRDSLGVPLFLAVILLVIFIVFVLLPLISVLGALIRHHGYQLSKSGETYRKTSGLLSRFDESLKQHKIQAMVLRQNFVAKLFKRSNMQLRVASPGKGANNAQLPIGASATFQVPVLEQDELIPLVSEFFPGCELDQVKFTRVNRQRLAMVSSGWGVLPPVVPITMVLTILVNPFFVLLLPLSILLAWMIINQVWRRSGFAVVGDYGFIRWGFIGTRITVFPLFKAQRIDVSQTPGQRRRKLARLTVHLASHSLSVPYVPEEDAKHLRDLALYHVETSTLPWY